MSRETDLLESGDIMISVWTPDRKTYLFEVEGESGEIARIKEGSVVMIDLETGEMVHRSDLGTEDMKCIRCDFASEERVQQYKEILKKT